ncbi:MAG: HAD family hydrolase [Bacteroidales bacterium]|jgi:histidinol-phosphate phosphatase family protein|nr:HAD family hydrolase [Bacteroidales bacterium]
MWAVKNKESAVFLDRDGVINRKIEGDYVRDLSQFELLPGAVDAIVQLGKMFQYVFIVTNQQGIGKGMMTDADLERIHNYIIRRVEEAGGTITRIYYCPSLESAGDPNRKPGIGMGMQAKKDFPGIDFSRSLMIGDAPSDLLFAKGLGMKFIFISETSIPGATYTCRSLSETVGMIEHL